MISTYKLQCDSPWFAFGPLLANLVNVSNSFESACLSTNLSSVIVPLIDVCTL